MREFKTRAAKIEAEQLTNENAEELARLCGGTVVEEIHPFYPDKKYLAVNVPTVQSGNVRLMQGQWLIRDVFGRWGVSSNNDFQQDFESVDPEPEPKVQKAFTPMDARKGKQI